MHLVDKLNIHNYHQHRIEKFGKGSVEALGWKTVEGQETRFETLAQIGDLSSCSVLDAGCGYGDLFNYLNKRYSNIRYIGVDQEESFLDIAISRYGNVGETGFFCGDFSNSELPVTDYVLASGALNYLNTDSDYIFKTITKLFNGCRIAFGFNMLHKIDDTNGLLVTYYPNQIVEYCKTLSSNVIFKEGYYENDFTVMMYWQVEIDE